MKKKKVLKPEDVRFDYVGNSSTWNLPLFSGSGHLKTLAHCQVRFISISSLGDVGQISIVQMWQQRPRETQTKSPNVHAFSPASGSFLAAIVCDMNKL